MDPSFNAWIRGWRAQFGPPIRGWPPGGCNQQSASFIVHVRRRLQRRWFIFECCWPQLRRHGQQRVLGQGAARNSTRQRFGTCDGGNSRCYAPCRLTGEPWAARLVRLVLFRTVDRLRIPAVSYVLICAPPSCLFSSIHTVAVWVWVWDTSSESLATVTPSGATILLGGIAMMRS